jgi:hypothetical protein
MQQVQVNISGQPGIEKLEIKTRIEKTREGRNT